MSQAELSGELKAMAGIEQALTALDEPIQHRVLRWACERFGLKAAPAKADAKSTVGSGGKAREDDAAGESAESLAEFYAAKSPSSDADKALVVAYWRQFHEGESDVEAQAVNTALKHLGHGVGNITRAFTVLKSLKPALIVQLRKEGTSRQARKKYKVTTEGKKAVDKMPALSTKDEE